MHKGMNIVKWFTKSNTVLLLLQSGCPPRSPRHSQSVSQSSLPITSSHSYQFLSHSLTINMNRQTLTLVTNTERLKLNVDNAKKFYCGFTSVNRMHGFQRTYRNPVVKFLLVRFWVCEKSSQEFWQLFDRQQLGAAPLLSPWRRRSSTCLCKLQFLYKCKSKSKQ